MGWPHGCDLGWGSRPKLHGMQGVKPLEWLSFLVLDAQRRVGRRSEPEGHHRWLHVGLYGERFGREPRPVSSPRRALNASTRQDQERIHGYAIVRE